MRHPRLPATSAFTIVEVLVAIFILVILMSTILPIFLGNAQANHKNETESQANVAISTVIDDLRTQTVASLPTTGKQTKQTTVNGKTYTVEVEYCRVSTHCTTSSRMLTARVYQGTTTTVLSSAETIFTEVNYAN